MRRLVGRPIVPGLAMGRARIIRTPADVALMAASAGVTPFWRPDDDADAKPSLVAVVLGDSTLAAACTANGQCAAVVHAASCGLEASSRLPTVDSVGPSAHNVDHDELLLVDAGRGIVLGDPSAQVLARFQAGVDGWTPRRRYYIDAAHQPVRLTDGRWMRVGACARSAPDMEESLAAGADALLVPLDGDGLLPSDVFGLAGGKPLCLVLRNADAPLDEVLEGAVGLDVTMICSGNSPDTFLSLRVSVQTRCEGLTRSDRDWAEPRLGIVVDVGANIASAIQAGVQRVVAGGHGGAACGASSELWLAEAAEAARSTLTPLEVIVGRAVDQMMGVVARAGVAGVWTTPDQVAAWKHGLRSLDMAEQAD